ncbi:ROK family protein [Clostridiales bacterium COT073_COT-073]|nr:ROK family protein [Clostridiales bacterium COT073_COT-073]
MSRLVFDIGGTNIKYGIFEDGDLVNVRETPTDAFKGGHKIMEKVAGLIEKNINDKIDSIGISTAGQVDNKKGRIVFANANIPDYTGLAIKKYLEDKFSLPCYVENDVNSAGLGELYANAEIDGDFVFIAYGTGIGGAIIHNNEVISGDNFFAGGIGQMLIFNKETMSYCEYESICSTKYLVQKAEAIDPIIKNGRMIFEHLDNSQIRALIDEWTSNIVIGLINVTYLIDPKYLVLGGGIMENNIIFHLISDKYYKAKNPFLRTEIKQAKLGNKSGLLGAAQLK